MSAGRSEEERLRMLQEAWAESYEKSRRLDKLLASRGSSIEPGDLIHVAYPSDSEIWWAVLRVHAEDPDLLLCVPADVFPLVGTPDVGVPASAASGPLSLRCGSSSWIPRGRLLPAGRRVGVLEEWHLDRANDKMDEVLRGRLTGSPEQQEADADIELEEWMLALDVIQGAVMEAVMDFACEEPETAAFPRRTALRELAARFVSPFELPLAWGGLSLASGGTTEWDETQAARPIPGWPYRIRAISSEPEDRTVLVVRREDARREILRVFLLLADGSCALPEGGWERDFGTGEEITFPGAGRAQDITAVLVVPRRESEA